jgi:hypothetical protein
VLWGSGRKQETMKTLTFVAGLLLVLSPAHAQQRPGPIPENCNKLFEGFASMPE